MPDYAALKAELDDDPLGLTYAGKTDAQVAALLNATSRPLAGTRTLLPAHEVLEAMGGPGGVRGIADANAREDVRLLISIPEVNAASTANRAVFAAAFPPGPVRTALLGLTTTSTPRTRAQEIFGGPVQAGDVGAARNS